MSYFAKMSWSHDLSALRGTYGKDGHLWKRRALMEKTGIMEITGIKFLKARFLVERLTPHTTSITHIVNKIQNTILTGI